MTTGKPPKRRTVKRGRPAKAEGKREGFENRSILPKKNTKYSSAPGTHPILHSQNKVYFHNKKIPPDGGIYNIKQPTTTHHEKKNKY